MNKFIKLIFSILVCLNIWCMNFESEEHSTKKLEQNFEKLKRLANSIEEIISNQSDIETIQDKLNNTLRFILIPEESLKYPQENKILEEIETLINKYNLRLLKIIINLGADINYLPKFIISKDLTPSETAGTLMHMAAQRGNVSWINFLFDTYKAKLDMKDHNGCTPLIIAVKNKRFKAAIRIMELFEQETIKQTNNNQDSNQELKKYLQITDEDHCSAFFYAIKFKSEEGVDELIDLLCTKGATLSDRQRKRAESWWRPTWW